MAVIITPRRYKYMDCNQLGHQLSLIFLEINRLRSSFLTVSNNLNTAMDLCASDIKKGDRVKAQRELRRAKKMMPKLKQIRNKLAKLREMHLLCVEMYKKHPNQPDDDQMF